MSDNGHERFGEELSAYLLGSLEPDEATALERHLADCERCREQLRWLEPAVDALPETVTRIEPPRQLRERLLTEVREDARRARAAEAGEHHGLFHRLRGSGGGWRWRPLAGFAAVLMIAAAVVGYEVGTGGSGGENPGTTVGQVQEGESGVIAAVVREGDQGQIQLSNVPDLPPDRVLEAWLERDGEIEAVPTLFVPNGQGHASTSLGDMRGVRTVMVTTEPPGGSKAPTSNPISTVPISTG